MSPRLLISPSGRLAPLPFAVAAIAIYLLSFGSQVLLSAPVTARMSVVPFALVQAALIWLWIVLHVQRLHDAGRSGGLAIGIGLVYALEVILLTIIVWLIVESSGGTTSGGVGTDAPILQLFVILYLLSLLAGDPSLGALQFWVIGIVALMLLPVAIALGFSLWAATRTAVTTAP